MASMGVRRTRHPGPHSEDLFVSSVSTIEIIGGGLVRLSFNVNRNHEGVTEAEPADFSLVMPLAAMPDGIGKAIAVTAKTIFARDDGTLILLQ